MIVQLDTENADLDISSLITVLTDTPDASNPMICQGLVCLGDGAKDQTFDFGACDGMLPVESIGAAAGGGPSLGPFETGAWR